MVICRENENRILGSVAKIRIYSESIFEPFLWLSRTLELLNRRLFNSVNVFGALFFQIKDLGM